MEGRSISTNQSYISNLLHPLVIQVPLLLQPAGTVPNLLLLPQPPPDEQLPHPIFCILYILSPLGERIVFK
ncbi:hypothetical protein E3D81_17135 [Sphingobacterium sp. CZ-2]|nr:hypothetical protein E3D81_17135 [Sphingobacterium sp. CZ-2]